MSAYNIRQIPRPNHVPDKTSPSEPRYDESRANDAPNEHPRPSRGRKSREGALLGTGFRSKMSQLEAVNLLAVVQRRGTSR
jgi:hypothetical protein